MRKLKGMMLGMAAAALVACGAEEDAEDLQGGMMTMDSMEMTTSADSAMAAAPGAAREPDHEFLRMMSDHHEGLEVWGSDVMQRAADDSVRSAASHLQAKQAAQQDTMVAMIQEMYGEQHRPTMTPKNAAQADSLRALSGPEVDRFFLSRTIEHHREGIEMIDRFLPRFNRPRVRQMAEGMRAGQMREIEELQGKLQQM